MWPYCIYFVWCFFNICRQELRSNGAFLVKNYQDCGTKWSCRHLQHIMKRNITSCCVNIYLRALRTSRELRTVHYVANTVGTKSVHLTHSTVLARLCYFRWYKSHDCWITRVLPLGTRTHSNALLQYRVTPTRITELHNSANYTLGRVTQLYHSAINTMQINRTQRPIYSKIIT
jgi:hypothetical protein